MRIFEEYDAAEAVLLKLPSLDARRKAAIALAPMIARMDRAVRERGEANGQDSQLAGLCAQTFHVDVARIRTPLPAPTGLRIISNTPDAPADFGAGLMPAPS